jgi:hypothetical protein
MLVPQHFQWKGYQGGNQRQKSLKTIRLKPVEQKLTSGLKLAEFRNESVHPERH